MENVLLKVLAIAKKADVPANNLIGKPLGENFTSTINLPGSKRTYVSRSTPHWNNGKAYTWWTWKTLIDTAKKGTEGDELKSSYIQLKNKLKTLYPAFERRAFKPETSSEFSFGNDVYLFANLVQGPDHSGNSDYVQLYITFLREANANHTTLVDSIKQNMRALVNNSQLTSKEIAGKIINEAKILEREGVNANSISELAVEIFSLAANKNMETAFELYVQWPEEKDLEKMKAKLSSSQSDHFKMLAKRAVDNHDNKTTPTTQTTATGKPKTGVPAYDPAKDSSCVFKAGTFLRFKETLTRASSGGLDAYVVSCKGGYYKIVTRKYVPGEKTMFAQNKNIPHYIISQSSAPRSYMEKEFVLSEDYKAGKKINVCTQCGGIGAEYYAQHLVKGKWESVNVTKNMGAINANVKITKSSCSKCYGDGWRVQD